MLHLCILLNIGISFSTADFVQDKSGLSDGINFKDGGQVFKTSLLPKLHHDINSTYIDKENIFRVPSTIQENSRNNKIYKTPKRTVQKIIRKGKSKTRKIYVHPITRKPTAPTKQAMNDFTFSNEDATTETNRRRKGRKNTKFIRNQKPFHKLQTRNRRNKRDASRELYILKDLDEIEFVSSKKDYNVINAHVKKYW